MKRWLLIIALATLAALGIWADAGDLPLPEGTRADRVVVRKQARRLDLYAGQTLLRTYRVSLGRTPLGGKQGGLVMIHGMRNGLGFVGRLHTLVDWTDGCVAVTNDEIEEILRVVPNETPIDIAP